MTTPSTKNRFSAPLILKSKCVEETDDIFTCVIVDEGAEDDGAVVVSRTCEHYIGSGALCLFDK